MVRVSKSFSGCTQLVGMALEGVRAERPLFALPPEPGLPGLFGDLFPRSHFLYNDYAIFIRDEEGSAGISHKGTTLSFAPRCQKAEEPYDLAVICLPAGKELIEYVFSGVSSVLQLGARVMIVGSKRSSIRSSKLLVEDYFGSIRSSQHGRHSVLIEAKKSAAARSFEGRKTYSVEAFGKNFQVVTLPGVFTHGRLDEGTRFLLDRIDPRALRFKKVLDLGCGAGVIGVALKLARPKKKVDFVDSNVMALEAARLTLEANGLDTDCVWPSDVFSDVRKRYDLIISNPPFHRGVRTEYSVAERLIREADRHLTSSGRLVVVTNAFLNYLPHFRQSFREVHVIAQNSRYRVIEASGRPQGS